MKDLRADLAGIIDKLSTEDGVQASSVPNVRCVKFSQPGLSAKTRWRASLAIIAQGSKETLLDDVVYRTAAAHYICAPIDLIVTSRIVQASPEKPFLCLLIDLNPLILSEIDAQMKKEIPQAAENPARAVFIGTTNDQMLAAAIRLGKLLQTPNDADVLAPLVCKELIYHLLKSANGAMIRQFARAGSKTHRISQAVYKLQAAPGDGADVASLANEAMMSRSDFFKYFKEVTAFSPIQYQKRLRLLGARRLMLDDNETAESAAFKIGYQSASQFSREYSRMFGNSPLRDIARIKKNGNPEN